MVIGWVRTAIRFTICEPAPWDVPAMWDALYAIPLWSHTIPSGLYNCRKYSTNHTFLCKTKPISEKAKLTQPLFNKQLTKIFVLFCNRKTKPIQTQFKPNRKMLAAFIFFKTIELKLLCN